MSEVVEFHNELIRRVIVSLNLRDGLPLVCYRLPNNTIPDITFVSFTYDIEIYEVKTEINASIVEDVYRKYQPWCNRLYICAPPDAFRHLIAPIGVTQWDEAARRIGLIEVHHDHCETIRTATKHTISPAAIRQISILIDHRLRLWSRVESGR